MDYYVEKLKHVFGMSSFEQICAVHAVDNFVSSIPKDSFTEDKLKTVREIHEIVQCIESPQKDTNIDKYLIEALVTRVKTVYQEIDKTS